MARHFNELLREAELKEPVERDQKPAAWMLELPISFFDKSDRLLIRIENLSQESFDLDVGFEGTDGMLDESLVEKVQA